MNKKLIKILLVLILMGILSFLAFLYVPKSYKNTLKLPEAILSANELFYNNSLSLSKKEGVWVSTADDNYPVDNDLVEVLLKELYQASINAKKYNEDVWGNDEITIKTPTNDEIKLYFDEISGQTQEILAVINDNKYLLNGQFAIPSQPFEWFLQPLLPFENENISEIYGIDPSKFSFSNIVFYQASKNNDFIEWDNKEIKVITNDGIVLTFTIYAMGHSYWMGVDITTTVMPTIAADEFIKNNNFLYFLLLCIRRLLHCVQMYMAFHLLPSQHCTYYHHIHADTVFPVLLPDIRILHHALYGRSSVFLRYSFHHIYGHSLPLSLLLHNHIYHHVLHVPYSLSALSPVIHLLIVYTV